MDINTMTLPKKGLKTRPYSMDMDIATLPKKDLKTRPYDMDMKKKYLKKLTKGQLIKLLLKQKESKKVHNHEHMHDNDPFKDGVAQEPVKRIKPPKPTGKPPPPPIPQVEDHIISVPDKGTKSSS